MSLKIECNGCAKTLDPKRFQVVIHGERANGMAGGHPLPDEDFDWCMECAEIAFAAVNKRWEV